MNLSCKSQESERVLALRRYQHNELREGSSFSIFDEFTSLVSIVCKVPMVLINFVDTDHQHTIAGVGPTRRRLDRGQSFCSQTIQQRGPLIVEDARKDARFLSLSIVTSSPGIRFYAGVPLKTADGFNIGAMCMLDTEPRTIDTAQLNLLSLLADRVMAELEARRNKREMMEAVQIVAAQRAQILSNVKLATLGEVAAKIAHEINNPLSVISCCAELILAASRDPSAAKIDIPQSARKIVSTVDRISKIITALSAFSRDVVDDPFQENSVRNIVEKTLALFSEKFSENKIEVSFKSESGPDKVECIESQIMQVLVNLLNNAVDAIVCHQDSQSRKLIQIAVREQSGNIEIQISNDGAVIPADVRNMMFQSFFTTKPAGKGTGLGLSISQDIVNRHGGSLRLDEASIDTRFIVTLPKRQANGRSSP